MSLVDDPATQRERIKAARAVQKAIQSLPDSSDEDIAVAWARLNNWITEQPQYVQDAIA